MPRGMTRSTLIKHSLIVLFALSGVLLRAGTQAAPDASAVATGAWGGEHVVLKVSEKGADVEFDCAHGQVTQPIVVDSMAISMSRALSRLSTAAPCAGMRTHRPLQPATRDMSMATP